MRFRTKRIYSAVEPSDGCRILIDRLWPRGITKQAAAIDFWAKDFAPSNELRRWYQHDKARWPEFQKRYFKELDALGEGIDSLRSELAAGVNTIVYASKEEELNNATALVLYLREQRQPLPASTHP